MLDSLLTCQNTMYCGGEPEHHIRNVTHVYILIAHKHVSCTCHEEPSSLASTCLRIIGARYYKFHAKLTGAPCFNNKIALDKIIIH